MEPKIIWVLLAAHLVQGSTIPVGLSSENWDKEYALGTLGQFKVKFNDVTDVAKGGRLYVELNVPNILAPYSLGVTNIQLDFTFKGLLDAKMSYKMTVNNALVEGQVKIVKALDGHAAVVVNGKEYILQDFKFETDKSTKIAVEMTVAGKVIGMKLMRITPDTISLDYYMDGVTVYNFVLENKLKTNLLDIKCNGRNIFNLNIEKFFDGTNIFTNTLTIQNIPKITFIIVKKWTGASLFIHHKLEANNQLLYSTEHAMTVSTNFKDQVRFQNNEKCFIPVTSPLYSILAGLFMTKTDFNLHRNVLIDINLGQGGRIVYKDTVHVGDDLHMHLGFDNAVIPYNFKIKLPVGLKVLRSFLGVTPKALGDNCCCDLEIGFKMGKKVTVKPSCMENTINAEWSGLGGSPVFSLSSVSGQSVDVLAEVEHSSPLSTYYIRINNQLEISIRHEVGKEIGIKSNLFIPQEIKISLVGAVLTMEYSGNKLVVLDLSLGDHLAVLDLPLVPETTLTITWDEKDVLKNRVEANLEVAGIRDVFDISASWSVKEESYDVDMRSSILTGPSANIVLPVMTKKARYSRNLEEMEKLMGQLLFFKKHGTIDGQEWANEEHWMRNTPLKSYEQLAPKVAIGTLVKGGKDLVGVVNAVTNVFLKNLKSQIEALENKIKEVQSAIDELTKEEREKIPEALELLYNTQQQLILTREKMVAMAADTMNRVRMIVNIIGKMGPGNRPVGKYVKVMLKKFEYLLTSSHTALLEAEASYDEISKELNHVRAHLTSFASTIMDMVKHKEDDMNNWIKRTRKRVYGGCAAGIIFPPIMAACYAISAPILENKIKKYKDTIALLKKMAEDGSIEAKKLAEETEKNGEFITEEIMLLNRWDTQVKFVLNEMEPVFSGDFTFDEFIDMQGKEETINMLCDLSSVCQNYIKHKYNLEVWEFNIPQITPPAQHALCSKFTCTTADPKEENPSNIGTLQLGNFELLGSIGDSLSAATGPDEWDPETLVENKLFSFVSGASPDKVIHSSLYNILLEFSPNLSGGSTGTNPPGGYAPGGGLNFATAGATLSDSMDQADKLVEAIKRIEGWEKRWKLITFQFGIADLCSSAAFGEEWSVLISATLDTLSELPKTVVLLMTPMDVTSFLRPGCVKPLPKTYDWLTKDDKCRSEVTENARLLEYHLYDVADRLRTDTFGIEVLPALKNFQVDTEVSGDCLHPSGYEQSMMGKNVWNNFVTPAKDRVSVYNMDALKIKCPDPHAYIPLAKPKSKTQPITLESSALKKARVIIENEDVTNDNVHMEFRNQDGKSLCNTPEDEPKPSTTKDLNAGAEFQKTSIHTYGYDVIEDCLFPEHDKIEFKVKTIKNSKFCLKNVEIVLPQMTLKSTGRACAEDAEEWQTMGKILKPCGKPI